MQLLRLIEVCVFRRQKITSKYITDKVPGVLLWWLLGFSKETENQNPGSIICIHVFCVLCFETLSRDTHAYQGRAIYFDQNLQKISRSNDKIGVPIRAEQDVCIKNLTEGNIYVGQKNLLYYLDP